MLKLSEIDTSVYYQITIPSTGKTTKFRPFRVREERALLTAQESEDRFTMMNTIESVIKSCIVNLPKRITTFDAEYLFMIIRSKSVGEESEVVIKCKSCEKETPSVINVTEAKVNGVATNLNIKLSDKLSVKMKYPTIDEVTSVVDSVDEMAAIAAAIDIIYYGNESLEVNDDNRDEVIQFLLNRSEEEMDKIVDFIDNIPSVSIEHKYRCIHCGTEDSIKIKGLSSFFG